MGSNSFGKIFKITTWGESHGKEIGVLIDGCPAGLEINEEEINQSLALRAPGNNPYTSPRKEFDRAKILSGIFEGKTTGAPICITISNQDSDPTKYDTIKDLLRPGHANYTYLEKYGIFDYRGGGRASARETAARVAAGALAKKLLKLQGIKLIAYIKQIGKEVAIIEENNIENLYERRSKNAIFCPDSYASSKMVDLIEGIKKEGDSLGGVVEFVTNHLPTGLGDPVYEKLEATLAYAMMSLPATKGFEIGSGFEAASMKGSEHNDLFVAEKGDVITRTNFSGGILGGISNGMPLVGRVFFKPTSSINKPQKTLTTSKKRALLKLPQGSRHDPCVAIRAVPVVEAMLALVLADSLLLKRCSKI